MIKTIFINYIICSVTGGVCEYLTPPKYRKTFRIIVISLLLISIFSPLVKSGVEMPEISFDESALTNQTDSLMHIANLTEKKVYKEVREVLIKNGVDEYEIYITVTPDTKNNIVYLDEVKVEIDSRFQGKETLIKKGISKEYEKITKVGVKNE